MPIMLGAARATCGHWPAVPDSARRARPAVQRRRARGLQRRAHRLAHAPAQAPGRAGEREVGDGGEALLVAAQREQQMRDAVAEGSSAAWAGAGRPSRSSRTPAAAGRTAATAPASPTSQRRAGRGSSTSPVRACSSRASWPTRSPSRPTERGSGSAGACAVAAAAPRRAQHVGAALRVELGDDPGVREADERDRQRAAARCTSAAPPRPRTGRRGRPSSASTAGRAGAAARRRRAGASGRPRLREDVDRRHRGERRGASQPPEIGRRMITSSALDRQLADLLGVAGPGADHREVAALELGAERRARRPRRRPGPPASTRRASSGRCGPCG